MTKSKLNDYSVSIINYFVMHIYNKIGLEIIFLTCFLLKVKITAKKKLQELNSYNYIYAHL